MERLQNALHRAREMRGQSQPQPGAAGIVAEAAPVPPVSTEVHELWSSLRVFQPNPRNLQASRIVSYFGKQTATPFDMMRTKMVHHARSKGWKRIAITSPSPRCGKTTIACNLAFSLSRQAEMRIMVVELDLRRPSIAAVLGLKEPQYFAKALAGLEPAEDHMVCANNNLVFGTNLAAAANPSELLQSQKTQQVLQDLEARYQPDLVLFDTAPVLASDDTLGFCEHVDAALIIGAAEMTTIRELDVTESELSEVTEVMGVVLNKCRYPTGGYGYEYEYGY